MLQASAITQESFLLAFFAYVGVLTAFSLWFRGGAQSAEGFLLGGRGIPLVLSLGTIVATLVGTGSSIGAVGQGYAHGWRGAAFGVGGGVGMIVLAMLFSDVRRLNFMTMSEEIAYYYGANRWVKAGVAVSMLFASIGWLGAHVLGGSYYLEYAGGLSPTLAKTVLTLAFGVYVAIGGYRAVVWIDSIQAVLLFAGFVWMACHVYRLAAEESPGLLTAPEQFEFLAAEQLMGTVTLSFAVALGILGAPSYRQRVYSAKDASTVRSSFLLSGVAYLLFCGAPAVIGICASRLNPGLENADFAFLYVAYDLLPAALGMFVLIAGLSATMSSASSDAIAAVSILMRDVYQLATGRMLAKPQVAVASRLGLLAILLAALALTLPARDIIRYIKEMIALVMSGLVVCSLLGKFWPRATWQGGVASLVGGGACTVYLQLHPDTNALWGGSAIPAFAAALSAGVIVSLLTPRSSVSAEEALRILDRERAQMESGDACS